MPRQPVECFDLSDDRAFFPVTPRRRRQHGKAKRLIEGEGHVAFRVHDLRALGRELVSRVGLIVPQRPQQDSPGPVLGVGKPAHPDRKSANTDALIVQGLALFLTQIIEEVSDTLAVDQAKALDQLECQPARRTLQGR